MREWPRSWTTKLILPLLFPKHGYLFNYSQYNFVNAYKNDINKPFLDKHIFLVFESNSNVSFAKKDEIEKLLKAHDHYYCNYNYRIDGKFYDVYAFTIDCGQYKNDIANIVSNNMHLVRYESKVRILRYWGSIIGSEEHAILFDIEVSPNINWDSETVTEEDSPCDLLYRLRLEQA